MAKELIRIYARNKSDVYLREIRTNLIPVIKKRIQDVQARLNLWLPVLKDLDARKNKESRVQNLERDIRDLVFRLQNVLETYSYEVQRSRCRNIIGKFIDDFKSFRIVDLEAKEVNIQITRIIEILSIVLESTKIEEERSHSANENPETETRQELIKSVTDSWENYIVGMDGQITDLKSVLLDGKRGVICIYGKDGMGKTTLAQKLYDSPCVQNHFEIRAWVELGPNIIVRNVLESILKQLPDGVGSMKTSDLTHDTVAEKFVKGKRYLFVLDDIRTLEHWNYFHAIFPNEQNGSKLMLTTQLKEVASSVTQADGLVHKIQTLSPSDSRELFLKTAFLRDPDEDDPSKEIAHKVFNLCGGESISVIVGVGKMLATKHTVPEWEKVLHDIELLIKKGQPVDQIILQKPISVLDDLPYYLKPCFLYLGLFPKGSKIEVEHLYFLWMAEGTISRNECQNNETMMDLAERYLTDLVEKKLVEVEEDKTLSLRHCKSCRVHDYIHDHLSRKSDEYFFRVLDFGLRTPGRTDSDNPARRMALHLGKQDDRFLVDQFRNEKANHLRSLLLLSPQDLQVKWPQGMFDLKKYRILRVLSFDRIDFHGRGLPRGITKLIYLRYLSFKGSRLEVLPSSIGNLSFLEILDLRVSHRIIIPNVLRKLVKLVYLYLPLEFQMTNNVKLYLGSLKELEILENFDTTVCNVADLFEMMRLRHLSTTVEGILWDLEQIVHRMDITSENTSVLFTSIKVKNFDCYTEERHSAFRKLLKCQILHTLYMDGHLGKIPPYNEITQSLTEMVLIGSQLKEDPMTTLGKLPELRVLVLQNNAFDGKKMICVESGFKKLKRLELSNLSFLEKWVVKEKSMPVLSILIVKNCRKLKTLPDELSKRDLQITFENDN